ncbi:MAG: SUMF1/EgtB/PvdO family nonheme iron enzyme [Anaerolineales bacterium]|nr:SUMF1/EgtB/PvdO family nonheme iron enzyme [Anaerolineales bacterium]
MDIPQLAAEIAKFLTPFLPYLISAGETAAKKASEKFGEAAWNQAQTLWGKLKPKAEERPLLKEAEEDLKENQSDEDAQATFRRQLTKTLEADESFAKIIAETVNFENAVNIGGNVEGSTIIAGKGNKIINAQTYIEGNVYRGPAPRDPQDALKLYRAVMANSVKNLSLHGIDPKASDLNEQRVMGLANVYIDLNTTAQVEWERANKIANREDKTKPLSVLEAIIKNQSLVIKGDPGSGKSTFVNYLTYCLSAQLTGRLENWNKEDSDLLPVVVILRDFIKSLKKLPEKAEPKDIWDFIEKRLKDQNLSSASKPILELLEQGKVILFFDGLDEVTTIPQRIFVRDAVTVFVKRYHKNRYVTTCRILSYTEPKADQPDLRLANFPEFEIAPFDDGQIKSFVNHWYNELTSLGMPKERAERLAENLLKQIGGRRELNKLAGNPLLLTIMAVVNTDEGQLPDTRAKLYETVIEKLLWQWEQTSKGAENARLRQLLQDAHCSDADFKNVIWKLAYEAHAQTDVNSEEEEALAGVSELSLQKALASINNNDLNWAASVIETMKLRAGLLLERENGVFTFPHRSFQEFLAGTYLESKDDFVARAKELAENHLLWRNVILWAVSRRVFIRGSLDSPLALIAELCPKRALTEKEWNKVWLAGDVLLEVGVTRAERTELGKELAPQVQNKLVELLEGNHLTPRERAEAGNTLAQLGDPRIGVIPHPQPFSQREKGVLNLLFCKIPAGKFLIGSPKSDQSAGDEERPQFEYKIEKPYFMSRYPVTNAQFEAFEKAEDGYAQAQWWTEAGLKWRKDRKEHARSGGVFTLANHPVVRVTWYEAVAFCKWATHRLQVAGLKLQAWRKGEVEYLDLGSSTWEIRLPSEAEWEYAARGGRQALFPWGKDEIAPNHANYSATNLNATSSVGAFPDGMNEYGLLDLSGNVWEWCVTEWQENYKEYLKKENNDIEGNSVRVLRGGSYDDADWCLRCAWRGGLDPDFEYLYIGFRCVVASISP